MSTEQTAVGWLKEVIDEYSCYPEDSPEDRVFEHATAILEALEAAREVRETRLSELISFDWSRFNAALRRAYGE